MTRFIFVFIIYLYTTLVWANKPELTLGFLLGGQPELARQQAVLFADRLQNELGQPVQVFFPKDYNGLVQAFKNQKVNVALFTALTYVQSEKEIPVKPLLKKTWEGPYYYSSLVTLKSSKIKSWRSLKGKKIAFVDPHSTSGYLYPKVFFQKNKILDSEFAEIIFTGNHAASIKALEEKKVDAVAVFSDDDNGQLGAWNRFSKLSAEQFKVLWVSDPIPNDPIVVSQEFYEKNSKFVHELMVQMIQIQQKNPSEFSEILGKGRLVPATAKQYDPVREMYKAFEKDAKK